MAAGSRSVARCPDLVELYGYHPYHKAAMCDHTGAEPELLYAVLRNGERLESEELPGLAGLYGCPVSVLPCPRVIMPDTKGSRYRKMIDEMDNLYIRLKGMAREGNQKAEESRHL